MRRPSRSSTGRVDRTRSGVGGFEVRNGFRCDRPRLFDVGEYAPVHVGRNGFRVEFVDLFTPKKHQVQGPGDPWKVVIVVGDDRESVTEQRPVQAAALATRLSLQIVAPGGLEVVK